MLDRIKKTISAPADALVLFLLLIYPFLLYRHDWRWKKLCFLIVFGLFVIWQLVRCIRRRQGLHISADSTLLFCAALALVLLLSPLLSPFGYAALDHRNYEEGSMIWGAYLLALLLLKGNYTPKRIHLYGFLLMIFIEGILVIINNCFINLFGNPANASTFASYNTLGAVMSMGYALNLALLLEEEDRRLRIAHYGMVFVLSVGLIFSRSDNVLIGVAAVLLFLLCTRAMNAKLIRRLLVSLSLLFLAFGAVRLLCLLPTFRTDIHTTGLLLKISRAIPWYLSLSAAALLLALQFLLKDRDYPNLSYILIIVLILVLALFALGFYLVNFTSVSFGRTVNRLFLFSDSSGSGRGAIWRVGLTAYAKHFTVFQKLIGTGLGSFGLFVENVPTLSGIVREGYCIPHCFLLLWLFEGGLVGLLSFCAVCFLQLKSAVKGTPLNRCAALTATAYLGAMLVTVSSPETTPLFIVFLALCSSGACDAKPKDAIV